MGSKESKKKFKLLSHSNGSHTLVDLENGQAMHSRIGPRMEADLVYAERARLEETLSTENSALVLFDVGLGTGSNVTAVLDRILLSPNRKGRLEVVSFETKPDGLRHTLDALDAFPEIKNWADPMTVLLDQGQVTFPVGEVDVHWSLRIGDFYSQLESAPTPDAIFFDFYSPKVVPELWSLERFQQIRNKIGEHPCRLFTYSAATPVRLHLLAAGFYVGRGASTGVKNETTIAATRLGLLENPLPKSWLAKLETSTSIADESYARAREAAEKNPQWDPVPSS